MNGKSIVLIILFIFFSINNASANSNDCMLVQINNTNWYFQTTQTDLPDGIYNYSVYVQDVVGNVNDVIKRYITIQQNYTIANITSWGNNFTNNQNINITIPKNTSILFNATTNTSADWHWVGAAYISGNGTVDSQADNYFDSMGTYIVSVYASRDAGNSNTITWTITVLPGCCFNISGYVTNVIELPLQDARIDLNNSHVFTDAAGYYEFTGIEEGTYPVLGRAIGYRNYTDTLDIAGNTTENITLNERTFGTVTTPGFGAISGIFIMVMTLIILTRKKIK